MRSTLGIIELTVRKFSKFEFPFKWTPLKLIEWVKTSLLAGNNVRNERNYFTG